MIKLKYSILIKSLIFLACLSACFFEPQPSLIIEPSRSLNLASQSQTRSSSYSSRSSSRSRRSLSSRSSYTRDTQESLTEETREVEEELVEEEGIDLDDYFDAAVYIYSNVVSCSTSASRDAVETCIDACSDATCIEKCLTTNSCDTGIFLGSGVFQSNTKVLTNHHVVEPAIDGKWKDSTNSIYYLHLDSYVESHDGDQSLVKRIEWYDTGSDVALIELNNSISSAFIPPHGSLSDIRPLTEVFTIGNPENFKWTASKGEITNISPRGYLDLIFFSIPIGRGNSGGGIFTMDGKLVGLVAFLTEGNYNDFFDNLNGGPHIDKITTLIRNGGGTSGPSLLSASQRQFSRSQERNYIEDLESAFFDARILR